MPYICVPINKIHKYEVQLKGIDIIPLFGYEVKYDVYGERDTVSVKVPQN